VQQRERQQQYHWKVSPARVEQRSDNGIGYAELGSQRYWYVRELLSMGIGDFRKRAISLLLAPWCITIKKMDHDTAERVLLDWTDKCQVVKPLDFDAYKTINQALIYAESRQRWPLGLFKVKDQSPELYTKLMMSTTAADTITKEKEQIKMAIRYKLNFRYCSSCTLWVKDALNIYRCPTCNQKLKTHPYNLPAKERFLNEIGKRIVRY
jgi:hypothetical protein